VTDTASHDTGVMRPSSIGWLVGSGEMATLVRAFDWAQTPLGPTSSWSPALRMIVGLVVSNRLPLLLWWGPDYISIYSDAYRPVLGTKHPEALGKPFREVWPEIRHILEPLIGAARALVSTALEAKHFVEEALRWLPETEPDNSGIIADAAIPQPAEPISGERPHVLLADDNADMRDYVKRLLAQRYQVEVVPDGEAALAAISRRKPDLLLTDVMMPRLDGIQLLARLRADPRTDTLPVILLSARAGEESRVEGMRVGADDYLIKPFSARELLARIEAHLNMARFRTEATERLRASEERYRAFVSASSDVVYRMSPDWSEMRYLQGKDFIADTETPSQSWLEKYVHADHQERVMEAIRKAIASKSAFELEHPVIRVDGAVGWALSRAIPVLGEDGEIVEWFGAARDVTERREWEDRQRVLVAELQHRTRNLIVIRSMAEKTSRASADLGDFRGRFRERLDALARVQGLLSRLDELDRVTFDHLIRSEISAIHDGADRVTLRGPPGVQLRSSTVQTLALALHELATNAVKYGALGQPAGRLAISWRFEPAGEDGKPWLHIDWREQGVEMPQGGATSPGGGQGRELIEQALPYQLKAKTSYVLEADGVHCKISVPASGERVAAHG
jgi:two-component sensor histidine kinase/CheY-like chemotaxis protein